MTIEISLDDYERDNLVAALAAIGGLHGATASPLNALHTGDWTLQLAWKLGLTGDAESYGRPNKTPAEMAMDANEIASSYVDSQERPALSLLVKLVQNADTPIITGGETYLKHQVRASATNGDGETVAWCGECNDWLPIKHFAETATEKETTPRRVSLEVYVDADEFTNDELELIERITNDKSNTHYGKA